MASSSDSRFPSSSPSYLGDPPPIPVTESFSYDVFLSFRGKDTRDNFTSHLYRRLEEAQISTFMDDDDLQLRKGGENSQQLKKAIEESRFSIIVFSDDYASSSWCLDELVKIMECKAKSGRVVIPVFYGVQPSDVRYQKGRFEEAFRLHEARYINQPDLLLEWRRALSSVASYNSFHLQSGALESESTVINLIMKEVLSHVYPKQQLVAKHPPPSSVGESFPNDVFLSFRGEDTRNNFTGHLYDRLVEAGIRTFMDDPELRKEGVFSLQLIRAIEETRVYIVVFSKNYASSRWCLDELVKILRQCDRNRGRMLLPVYYGVQPSDVRYQKESFEEAFRFHDAKYINQLYLIETWRNALFRAVDYSGFDWQSSALGSESSFISLIVKEVLFQVKPKTLHVAKYPVGMDSRVDDVHSLLSHEFEHHVPFIGIWGMGGCGKTAIAKAVYNKILQSFDSSCFLGSIREHSEKPYGLVHLQEKLISELLMRTNVKVSSVDVGMEMIGERFCRKKVLIVLDDADKLSQVDALVGLRDQFGPGSKIIITTRDQYLLNQVQVDGIYEAKELNYEESLELFSWHSFKKRLPDEPFGVIAEKIVAYSCGLPLALEVLGTSLFGRTVQEWNSDFDKLQKVPHPEIQKILQISYYGLDDEQRKIFIEIACFYIGMDINYVTKILDGYGFNSEIGIKILKNRCLLKIDMNNVLRMHDLLRDMGMEIIRQQSPPEPSERSRRSWRVIKKQRKNLSQTREQK